MKKRNEVLEAERIIRSVSEKDTRGEKKMTATDFLKELDKQEVKYVRLWFTDILGQLKGMDMTRREMEGVLERGQGFDGSSIEGFVRIEESDLVARPDLSTFRVIPWPVGGVKVGMLFCDVYNPDGSPHEGDPRYILRRTLDKIKKLGYTYYCGPEIEYFYLKSAKEPQVLDREGYFSYGTIDIGTHLRKKTATALEAMGIPVECTHHEVAPSQHEIDLRYQDALTMADQAMIYRLVVKELAAQEGVYATFMPKPIFGENGSGMHCHQSLFKGKANLFFDAKDKYHLSEFAKQYIAGILTHIREITLILCQWVNSYKRLVVGYEAPVYISWGRRNRSSLVRVPMYQPGKENATRVELRCPDPACNPYLAFAVMLAAGMKGVEGKYPIPEPVEEDIYEMDEKELKRHKIGSLPSSLPEAIELAEKSPLVRGVLGDHLFTNLIANKKMEWDRYRMHVSQYEIDTFLPVL